MENVQMLRANEAGGFAGSSPESSFPGRFATSERFAGESRSMTSESRPCCNRPRSRRLSVGLAPDPRGVATDRPRLGRSFRLEPGSILTGLALSPIAPLHDRGAYSAGIEKGLALALIAWELRSLVYSIGRPAALTNQAAQRESAMATSQSNKQVVREYVAAFNRGDMETLRKLFTPDAV